MRTRCGQGGDEGSCVERKVWSTRHPSEKIEGGGGAAEPTTKDTSHGRRNREHSHKAAANAAHTSAAPLATLTIATRRAPGSE